ncbi:hypothetical protein C0J08_13990 [Marinomonas sp. CT5]|nr:hypothetical protein C0J08_13990 [Marinomonas sp. CT5]
MSNSYCYRIYYPLHSAKKLTTRETRMAKFLVMLEYGGKSR